MRSFLALLTLLVSAAASASNAAAAGAGHSALRKQVADGTPAERRERVRGQARALLVNLLTPRFPEIP